MARAMPVQSPLCDLLFPFFTGPKLGIIKAAAETRTQHAQQVPDITLLLHPAPVVLPHWVHLHWIHQRMFLPGMLPQLAVYAPVFT
jgi:hypothetical protein